MALSSDMYDNLIYSIHIHGAVINKKNKNKHLLARARWLRRCANNSQSYRYWSSPLGLESKKSKQNKTNA